MFLSTENYVKLIRSIDPVRVNGKITQIIGLTIESQGPDVRIGELCSIYPAQSQTPIQAEVVGIKENKVLLMPLGEVQSIGPGCDVVASGKPITVKAGSQLLGRVLDGLGQPIDGMPLPLGLEEVPTYSKPPNPLSRPRILSPLRVGVRTIDGLLTMGKGQRIGIFAGSGVGKSTLLGMISRNTTADVNVIALIGERGREVNDFLEQNLGEEGLKKSVVIVATSDQPALIRIKGALTATSIAEYFRNQGKNVLLVMDSVTRFAMAQREIGLAIGEPPTTKGYTPSVFAMLPQLLERAGTGPKGSISAIYTVLVDGDDMNEPIADAVRGILDGHIVLNRSIAGKGIFPAIDVLNSASRVMTEITSDEHLSSVHTFKKLLASYNEAEDLINIGAYKKGSNRDIDLAIRLKPQMDQFLRQGIFEASKLEDAKSFLISQFGAMIR
ncbi:flagellar protein export ATPase FliI [Neobacillus massiliamazoniensis]|uniref:Flagellum-specific ATP synthase n=1 Tax=Neobacillus massiliamazoniensis TaxID=1499688 RepID=A0A0U1NT51_9BACI|nr:flagellar protein export ATPase FliI [Neobacillus massiliamazoniensis]CRK80908.1 flagellum-specific ATP synthase [Neobacillus massiliamazoniensis]